MTTQKTDPKQGNPEGSTDDGNSDIDSLIGQYEQGTQQQDTQSQSAQQGSVPEGFEDVVNFARSFQQEKQEQAIQEVVKTVKGDYQLGDELVRGYIEVEASKDKTIADAFANRVADPKAWQAKQSQLMEGFKKQFPTIDEKATQDTNELMAAVAGSKETNPGPDQAPAYEKMSDADFRKETFNMGF
jgi:DNA-binding ferritin-like protein